MWRAATTTPRPPAPRTFSIRYFPARTSPSRSPAAASTPCSNRTSHPRAFRVPSSDQPRSPHYDLPHSQPESTATRASPTSDVRLNDARDVESGPVFFFARRIGGALRSVIWRTPHGDDQKARGLGPALGARRGGWPHRARRGGLGVPTKRWSYSA